MPDHPSTPASDLTRLAALAAFAPKLEQPGATFGEPDQNGFGGYALSDLGMDFWQMVFDAGWAIKGFKWSAWMISDEARHLIYDPAAMASATIEQIAMLLTVIVNAERFTDSTLATYFENGTLLAMAKRAEGLLAGAA